MNNKILILLVLYQQTPEESISYRTLSDSIEAFELPYELVIFNNFSDIRIQDSGQYHVINSVENLMLSGAYNHALKLADKYEANWLLLLDQDSTLTKAYFSELSRFLFSNNDKSVVQAVPKLFSGNKMISPHTPCFYSSYRKSVKKQGIHKRHIISLNSVSLLNVEFIKSVGGFSPEFPLDMLDYSTSLKIYKAGKKTALLDVALNHDLSVTDKDTYMSEERYKGLLNAESRYYKTKGPVDLKLYKVRLIVRFIKQKLTLKNKELASLTHKHLFN